MTDEQIKMNVLRGRQIDGQRIGQLVVGQGPVMGLERLVLGFGARRLELTQHLLGLFFLEPAHDGRAVPHRRASSACSSVKPSDECRMCSTLLVVWPGRLEQDSVGVLERLERRRGGVEIAVGVVRAAGAKHDVRADQAGEEHHFRGQEQPHGDLAGRDRRDAAGTCGRGRRRVRRSPVVVELWVATAIVITTLEA